MRLPHASKDTRSPIDPGHPCMMVSALCQGMSVDHAELNEARALAIPAADQEMCS